MNGRSYEDVQRSPRLRVTRDGRVFRGPTMVGTVHRFASGSWGVRRIADGGAMFPRTFRTRRDALVVFAVRPGSIAEGIIR